MIVEEALLAIEADRHVVVVHGTEVPLTPRELQVLQVLAASPGRVLQRQEIYEQVWGGQMPYRDRSVDVWVKKLREKLTAAAPEYRFVHTHYGFGYRLSAESA